MFETVTIKGEIESAYTTNDNPRQCSRTSGQNNKAGKAGIGVKIETM